MRNILSSILVIITSVLVVISIKMGLNLLICIGLIACIVLSIIDIIFRIRGKVNGRKEKENTHINGSEGEV